jgi:hypothetical protein
MGMKSDIKESKCGRVGYAFGRPWTNCAYAMTYATLSEGRAGSLPALQIPKIGGSMLKILLHFGRHVSRINVIRRLGVVHFGWLYLPWDVSKLLERLKVKVTNDLSRS